MFGRPVQTYEETYKHTYRQRLRDTVIQIEPATIKEVDQFLQRLEQKRCALLAAPHSRNTGERVDKLILRLKAHRAILAGSQRWSGPK